MQTNIMQLTAILMIVLGGLLGGYYIYQKLDNRDVKETIITDYDKLDKMQKKIVDASIESIIKNNYLQYLDRNIDMNILSNKEKLWLVYLALSEEFDSLSGSTIKTKVSDLFGSTFTIDLDDIYTSDDKLIYIYDKENDKYINNLQDTFTMYEVTNIEFVSYNKINNTYEITLKPMLYRYLLGCSDKIDFYSIRGDIIHTEYAENEDSLFCYALDIKKDRLIEIFNDIKSDLPNVIFNFQEENRNLVLVGYEIE